MLRDCNTLVSNISVQLLNRDTGKMVRSALRTAAVALQSRCYFKVAGNTKQSVLRLVQQLTYYLSMARMSMQKPQMKADKMLAY